MSSRARAAPPCFSPGVASPPKPPAAVTGSALVSPKIRDGHLMRLAIVYVRQSTPHQVLEHHASRERQYALADAAVTLGWPKDRVLVIDEDHGQSGKTGGQDRA